MAGFLRVVSEDESTLPPLTGRAVLREIADLIEERLPLIPYDDERRPMLMSLVQCAPPRTRGA